MSGRIRSERQPSRRCTADEHAAHALTGRFRFRRYSNPGLRIAMAQSQVSDALRFPKGNSRFRELRALIVDDDRHMRKVLRMLLLGYGAKDVSDAADGESGIKLITEVRPHIVVTDYDMKPM